MRRRMVLGLLAWALVPMVLCQQLQLQPQRQPLRNPISSSEPCGSWSSGIEETWDTAESEWGVIQDFVADHQGSFRLPELAALEDVRDSAYIMEDAVGYLFEHHFSKCKSDGCTRREDRADWDSILVESQAFTAEIEDYIEWLRDSRGGNQNDRFKETAKTKAAIRRLRQHLQQCLGRGGSSSGKDRIPDEALDILYAAVRATGRMSNEGQAHLERRDIKGYLNWMERLDLSLPSAALAELEAVDGLPSSELQRIRDFAERTGSGARRESLSREARRLIEGILGTALSTDLQRALERGETGLLARALKDRRARVTPAQLSQAESLQRRGRLSSLILGTLRRHSEGSGGFSRSAILALERGLNQGRRLPSEVERGLVDGRLEPFKAWAQRERLSLERTQWRRLRSSLERERVPSALLEGLEEWALGAGSSLKMSRRSIAAIQSFVGVRRIPSSVERELKDRGSYAELFAWMERERLDIPRQRLTALYTDLSNSNEPGWRDTYEEFRRWWEGEFGRDGRSPRLSADSLNSLRIFAGRTIPASHQAELRRGELDRFLAWAAEANRRYGIPRAKLETLLRQLDEQDVTRDHIRRIRRWWTAEFDRSRGFSPDAIAALEEFIGGSGGRRLPFSVERELKTGSVEKLLPWLDREFRGRRRPGDSALARLRRRLEAERVPTPLIRAIEEWHRGSGPAPVRRGLNREAVTALQDYLGPGIPRIPSAVRRDLERDGSLDSFLAWAREERQKLNARRLSRVEAALRSAKLSREDLDALRRYHSEGAGSRPGIPSRPGTQRPQPRPPPTTQKLRLGSRSIRQLKALSGLRSFPRSVSQHLAAGDLQPYFELLTTRRIRPSASAKRDFARLCQQRRLRKPFCDAVKARLRISDQPTGGASSTN